MPLLDNIEIKASRWCETMTKEMTSDSPLADGYRIGAVCRLTGLSPHVLRMWEKRYGVVTPGRSPSQRRLYSEADVRKLSLLKMLVDRGQAIGTLVRLDIGELQRRAEATPFGAKAGVPARKLRIAVVGPVLQGEAEQWTASECFEMVSRSGSVSEFLAALSPPSMDLLVLEWPTIHSDTASEVTRALPPHVASRIVVVYRFASTAALRKIETTRIMAVRAPLTLAAMETLINSRFMPQQEFYLDRGPPAPVPTRKFSDLELTHVAQQAPSVLCECPRHLSELITSLNSFESYSAECESRNEEDAAVHAYLYATTAQARSLLEQGLAKVIELEGLTIAKS